MPRCLIALGGNEGDVSAAFSEAIDQLDRVPHSAVAARSRMYSTPPVGAGAGAAYLNAAVELQTELSPLELLAVLQSLEHHSGRRRSVRWGPRPLDLDLIAYGDCVIAAPDLQVPHPACWYRRFVLDPVCDIAADFEHPERGVSFGELRQRLLSRPLPIALAGGSEAVRHEVFTSLAAEFPAAQFSDWNPASAAPSAAAIVAWFGGADPRESAVAFDSLPKISRLNLAPANEPVGALRDVLQSALMEPAPLEQPEQ